MVNRKNPLFLPFAPRQWVMNVRFDPKRLSAEEKASLSRTMTGMPPDSPLVPIPASTGTISQRLPQPLPHLRRRRRRKAATNLADPRTRRPPPQDVYPKPPSEAPKATTKPPPPMRPKSDPPKTRPIHLWQPSIWDMAKPFYDWRDPKAPPPDHLPLPQSWTLEHIISPPNLDFSFFSSDWRAVSESQPLEPAPGANQHPRCLS